MDSDAIEKIVQLSAKGNTVDPTSTDALIVPDNCSIRPTEIYGDYPKRFRGRFDTQDVTDFTDYYSLHATAGSKVFVDAHNMSAVAVFDYTVITEPGWCDNTACFKALHTAEYSELREHIDSWLDQNQFIHFIEDMNSFLTFLGSDDKPIANKKVIQSLRKVKRSETSEVSKEVQDYSQEGSVLSEVKIVSPEDSLPSRMIVKITPYEGFGEYTFEYRVAARISTLEFKAQQIQSHIVKNAIKVDFLAKLESEIDSDNIYNGSFKFMGPQSR